VGRKKEGRWQRRCICKAMATSQYEIVNTAFRRVFSRGGEGADWDLRRPIENGRTEGFFNFSLICISFATLISPPPAPRPPTPTVDTHRPLRPSSRRHASLYLYRSWRHRKRIQIEGRSARSSCIELFRLHSRTPV